MITLFLSVVLLIGAKIDITSAEKGIMPDLKGANAIATNVTVLDLFNIKMHRFII